MMQVRMEMMRMRTPRLMIAITSLKSQAERIDGKVCPVFEAEVQSAADVRIRSSGLDSEQLADASRRKTYLTTALNYASPILKAEDQF